MMHNVNIFKSLQCGTNSTNFKEAFHPFLIYLFLLSNAEDLFILLQILESFALE